MKSENVCRYTCVVSLSSLLATVALLLQNSIKQSATGNPQSGVTAAAAAAAADHVQQQLQHVDDAVEEQKEAEAAETRETSESTAASEAGEAFRDKDDDLRAGVADNKYSQLAPNLTQQQQQQQQFANASVEQQQLQRRRHQLLTEACAELNVSRWSPRQLESAASRAKSLLVNDEQKYIYCKIPKAASTSWLRVLLVASGQFSASDPNRLTQSMAYIFLNSGNPLRSLASYDISGIEYRLKNYFKFVFVRHPLDRLASAFRDRLRTSNHVMPQRLFARQIRKFRRSDDHVTRKGLQLPEFVRYINAQSANPGGMNQHWRPLYDTCFPCHIDYDFIGHYETLNDDAQTVLDRIGISWRVRFPTTDRDSKRRKSGNMSSARWNRIYAGIDHEDLQRLRTDVYGKDLAVFGYE